MNADLVTERQGRIQDTVACFSYNYGTLVDLRRTVWKNGVSSMKQKQIARSGAGSEQQGGFQSVTDQLRANWWWATEEVLVGKMRPKESSDDETSIAVEALRQSRVCCAGRDFWR